MYIYDLQLAEFDLVVTTYETLASDYRASVVSNSTSTPTADRFPVLLKINWFRVIFDESHKLQRNFPAALKICSLRRWCVTGTPFNAKIEAIMGQFAALGVSRLSDEYYWKCLSTGHVNRFASSFEAGTVDAVDTQTGYSMMCSMLIGYLFHIFI